MTRHFKLLAAVAVVLVTISGFSPARSSGGKGGSSGHSSRGGGCSSSDSSSHNSSTSSSGGSGSHDKGSGQEYARDSGRGSGDGSHRLSNGSRNNGANGGSHNSGSRNGSASGTVLKCAAAGGSDPGSSVRVRNSASASRTYTVEVTFLDAQGVTVDNGSARATVARNGTRTVDVRMDDPTLMDRVDRCRLKSVR